MIPKEAIEKAIEGGWNSDKKWIRWTLEVNGNKIFFVNYKDSPGDGYPTKEFEWEQIALDPSFWKCLGKALGWSEEGAVEIFEKNRNGRTAKNQFETRSITLWRHYAFEFYNLIHTGGDTDAYWKEILSV